MKENEKGPHAVVRSIDPDRGYGAEYRGLPSDGDSYEQRMHGYGLLVTSDPPPHLRLVNEPYRHRPFLRRLVDALRGAWLGFQIGWVDG